MAKFLSGKPSNASSSHARTDFTILTERPWIKAVFECGMLARKDQPWFASSPDLMAIVNLSLIIEDQDLTEVIAVVEFKTGVGASTVSSYLQNASVDAKFCEFGDSVCTSVRNIQHPVQFAY